MKRVLFFIIFLVFDSYEPIGGYLKLLRLNKRKDINYDKWLNNTSSKSSWWCVKVHDTTSWAPPTTSLWEEQWQKHKSLKCVLMKDPRTHCKKLSEEMFLGPLTQNSKFSISLAFMNNHN